MFQFPFGTMHQLNLDWFLQQWQQLRQDWIDEEQNIEDSMQDVYDARDAAIQAKDDAVSAKNDAQTAKASADADALISEGFALGEQNGTPVGAGSPYYQANSKFYSTTAGTYRYLSEAYARGTMGGTPVDPGDAGYEDNAKYYKDAAAASAQDASDDADYVRDHVTDADASALEAEGFAVGEQGGTPVASGSPYYENNAKYYAGEAQQDKLDTDTLKDAANAAALRAEGWADGEQNGTPVSSGSPYYENNAKYYKDLAELAASGMAQAIDFADFINKNYPSRLPYKDIIQGTFLSGDLIIDKNIVSFPNGLSLREEDMSINGTSFNTSTTPPSANRITPLEGYLRVTVKMKTGGIHRTTSGTLLRLYFYAGAGAETFVTFTGTDMDAGKKYEKSATGTLPVGNYGIVMRITATAVVDSGTSFEIEISYVDDENNT